MGCRAGYNMRRLRTILQHFPANEDAARIMAMGSRRDRNGGNIVRNNVRGIKVVRTKENQRTTVMS
jgi:hypothetical protein